MGEFDTEVVIPQIGVSVKVDDVDVREFFKHSAKGAESYQVFAAQHERAFVGVQDASGLIGDRIQCSLGAAEWQFDVSDIGDIARRKGQGPDKGCSFQCRRTRGGLHCFQSGFQDGKKWCRQMVHRTVRWKQSAIRYRTP